jgi:hypothetical protein
VALKDTKGSTAEGAKRRRGEECDPGLNRAIGIKHYSAATPDVGLLDYLSEESFWRRCKSARARCKKRQGSAHSPVQTRELRNFFGNVPSIIRLLA